jgi:alpha-1,6-mannosyltransferase
VSSNSHSRRQRTLAITGCGLVLLALTGVGLFAQRQHNTAAFVAVALVQGAVYVAAVALLWRGPSSRSVIVTVLALATVMRLAVLPGPPYLSNDVYRYVWDGRVIAVGINPYRYIPADPHLAALRDAAIFPNINRRNYAHTIYPPAAEAIFFAVTRVSASVTAMKAAMVGFEAIAIAALLRLLVFSGQPPVRIAIYAWHPLPLWEFAGSGHIDAAIVALAALALWSRRAKPGGLTGLALAGGTLVKFYPVAIAPALWRRWDWRMPAVFAGAVLVAYLPFVGVGWGVFGFLPHYAIEEGLTDSGGGFYLWDIACAILAPLNRVPAFVYLAAAAILGAGLAVVATFRHEAVADDAIGAAALLAGAFTLLLSPHYPWYFVWLVAFACLAPSPALGWLTLASFLLYLVPVWPQAMRSRPWLLVQSIIYAPFLLLAAIELWRRRSLEQVRHDGRALSR